MVSAAFVLLPFNRARQSVWNREREIESTLRSHRCKLLESAESGKLAGKKTRLPFIAHKQGPESRSVSISTASLFSASDISTIESVAYI